MLCDKNITKRGFTLVELLVVIAVIVILLTITITILAFDARNEARIASLLTLDDGIYKMLFLDCVGAWKFEDSYGGIVTDGCEKNDGVILGSPTEVEGVIEGQKALYFNGAGDAIRVAHSSNLVPTSFTISLWFKRDGAQVTWSNLFRKGGGSPYALPFNIGFVTHYDDNIGFAVGYMMDGGGKGYSEVRTGRIIEDDTWYHLVATHDNNSGAMYLYIDGKVVDETMKPNWPVATDTSPIDIGSEFGSGQYFKGTLDDIRLYSSAMTVGSVAQIYNLEKKDHQNYEVVSVE